MKKETVLDIKPANDADLGVIQKLAYEIWPGYYASIISIDQIEYMLRNLYAEEALMEQKKAGTQFFIASEGKKVVGFLAISPKPGQAFHIDKLYLLPDCRGKGFGKQLVDYAGKLALQKKAGRLTLNVNRFNESLWFYRAIGFTIEKEVDIPFGPYLLTDYIMQLPLAS